MRVCDARAPIKNNEPFQRTFFAFAVRKHNSTMIRFCTIGIYNGFWPATALFVARHFVANFSSLDKWSPRLFVGKTRYFVARRSVYPVAYQYAGNEFNGVQTLRGPWGSALLDLPPGVFARPMVCHFSVFSKPGCRNDEKSQRRNVPTMKSHRDHLFGDHLSWRRKVRYKLSGDEMVGRVLTELVMWKHFARPKRLSQIRKTFITSFLPENAGRSIKARAIKRMLCRTAVTGLKWVRPAEERTLSCVSPNIKLFESLLLTSRRHFLEHSLLVAFGRPEAWQSRIEYSLQFRLISQSCFTKGDLWSVEYYASYQSCISVGSLLDQITKELLTFSRDQLASSI